MVKPWLMFYHCGARGDFLASILFGDVLAKCWDHPTIQYIGSRVGGGNLRKMHQFGSIINHHNNIETFDSPSILLDHRTIRIAHPTFEEQRQVTLLWLYKHSKLDHTLANDTIELHYQIVCDWEKTNSVYDSYCSDIVEFKALFDLRFLAKLREDTDGHVLTDLEKNRIQHNININLDIISRCSSMDRTRPS